MTTSGRTVSDTKWYTKLGEEFQVSLVLAANADIDWSGATGKGQLRRDDGTLVHDFGTANGTLDGDGNCTLTFTANSASTSTWPVGRELFVDFSFQTGAYGPRLTKTFRVIVADGPTNL